MFQIRIKCPKCLNEIQNWDPSQTLIKCSNCQSEYYSKNGIFYLYPDVSENQQFEIQDRSSSFAGILDESINLSNLNRIIPELFFKQIKNVKTPRVFLDAGCGYGDLSIAACEFFDQVIAIDAGDQELEFLAKRIKDKGIHNITVIKTSIMNLPFVDKQFSAIGCVQVLEHVIDANKAIKNLFNSLSMDGLLYISTPNKYSIKPEVHTKLWGIGFLPKKFALAYARFYQKESDYRSIHLVSIKKLKKLLIPYFDKNIKFIRSGFHKSFFGKLAKWSWNIPLLKQLAYLFVADIEVIAYKE